MARKELSVEGREVLGKKVAALRRTGVLPGNVYGHHLESLSVQISTEDMEKMLRSASANEVIDLKVVGEKEARPVVIHHIQRHPMTSGILHANFYQVSLKEKMRADVPIVITGVSTAVATYNGVLLPDMEALHIEALPLDIPTHIEVDITSLTELEMAIHVRDLNVPANVTVLTDPDVVVVRVASPSVSEEVEIEAAAATVVGTAAEAGEEPAGAEEESSEASSD